MADRTDIDGAISELMKVISEMTPKQQRVAVLLLTFTSHLPFSITLQQLADAARCSWSTSQKAVAHLSEKNILRLELRGGDATFHPPDTGLFRGVIGVESRTHYDPITYIDLRSRSRDLGSKNYIRQRLSSDSHPSTSVFAKKAEQLRQSVLRALPAHRIKLEEYWKRRRAAWARELRLLVERDGVNPDLLDQVITWLPTHDFWGKTCQSAKNLRRNWDRIAAEFQYRRKPARPNGNGTGYGRVFRGWEHE